MMEEYPSGDVVTLDGSQTQKDGGDVFDYTGYVCLQHDATVGWGSGIA
jgi:hypothetical protein